MAKKLPGLRRVLGASPLASVAYGEIGSSLYLPLAVVAGVAGVRLVRRPSLYRATIILAGLALVAQLLLVALGLVYLFSTGDFGKGVDLGTAPTWHAIVFALPVAMLAYTGLETVANLAAETREPGRDLPRSLFAGIGAVVLVLVMGVTTAISGAGRLAYSLGRRNMLPHAFGVLNRRTLIAPISIASVAAISIALLIGTVAIGRPVRSLAALYSFSVLLTFLAAQVAVVRLRATEPDLPRPFRVPVNVRIRGVSVPMAALLGIPLTFLIWVAAVATHPGARIAGPV